MESIEGMIEKPLVSVILAARDEEELIGKSLKSILNQTYPNIEIVVVNDGSTDSTEDIVRGMMDNRKKIKLINIEHKSEGINTAIPKGTGINNSRGEFLFIAEADACYTERYLEECLKPLEDPLITGSVGKIRVWAPSTWISKSRDVLYRVRWSDPRRIQKWANEGKIAPFVFKRRVYDALGGYRVDIGYAEDREFAKRMLESGYRVKYVPEVEWYHKWDEKFWILMRSQFNRGRQNFMFSKGIWMDNLKKMYLLSLPFLLVGTILYHILIILVALQLLPLIVKGIVLFIQARDCKNRWFALLFPFYVYAFDFPFALGFFYQPLFGKKKFVS
jgi:glycosyltransferase involved in cell wall biosynthesis